MMIHMSLYGIMCVLGVWTCVPGVWTCTFGCLDLYFGCPDLCFGRLHLYFGRLDLYFGCLVWYFGQHSWNPRHLRAAEGVKTKNVPSKGSTRNLLRAHPQTIMHIRVRWSRNNFTSG